MSELDQRLLDGIKLTGDAFDAGRLGALTEAYDLLAKELDAWNRVLVTETEPVARTKARGAYDAIWRVLREFEGRVNAARAQRGS